MGEFLGQVNQFMQQVMYWMGLLIDFILAEPLLVLFLIAMPVVRYIADIFRRLLHG